MGHSRCTCAHSLDSAAFCNLHFNDNNLPSSLTTFLRKMMIWELGLSCFFPKRPQFEQEPTNSKTSRSSDQNKTWLLAESAGGPELTAVEPQSVHSSFRFSLCSQVEVETMNKNQPAAATILMVNLGSGLEDSDGVELHQRWSRIESLEKSILPFTRNTLIKFSYTEILSASHHFSKGRVLGRGARSYVFRGRVGILRTAVAIKRLDKEDKESSKAFCRELMIASSLRHPNVAPLIGFCIDAEEGFFLVYKYVSGGSLERHLHDKKKGNKSISPLGWSKRYKVAVGIAEAIAHLHYGSGRCVVHRDIKPSNILLSSNKNPKLCDFGLASWTPAPSIPFLCKTVKGTFGYLAPEYFQHGKVSDKTDVYALGVVLLELITGRKPIESKRPPGEENLVIWAKPLLQKGLGAAEELLDPRIKPTLRNSLPISLMIEAAAACINTEESRRPSINEIVAILRGENRTILTKIRTNNIPRNVVDYPLPLQQTTKSEMNNHLALAMLGVSEINNDDDDLFYWQ